eukprot:gene23116-26174_t
MSLKRKNSDGGSGNDDPVVKKEKTEADNEGFDVNLEIQTIIKDTPSNSPETSILAMLGKGAVYNEATFKQKIEQALARGGNVNMALIEASKHCQFHLVQPLVDLGADVNFGDEIGMTPLHIAAANLNAQGIQILLNLGANRRAKANTSSTSTPKMQTPVQIARDWKRLIKKNFGMCKPDVELVVELLK